MQLAIHFPVNNSKTQPQKGLSEYLPKRTLSNILDILENHPVEIKITKSRASKLGDYRPPTRKKGHIITINNDLNQYTFLITLVHEIAHMFCWGNYKYRIKPHGKQWKQQFRKLMQPYLTVDVFPEEILNAIIKYISNPAASSCSDENLQRLLSQYDAPSHFVYLEDLPEDSIFKTRNDKVFRKGRKMRTRYKCLHVKSKKQYYVPSLTEVISIEKESLEV